MYSFGHFKKIGLILIILLGIILFFGYNPFLMLSFPYLIALVITQWFDPQNRLARLKRICRHQITVNTYLILIIVWWIARNLLPIFRDTTSSIG